MMKIYTFFILNIILLLLQTSDTITKNHKHRRYDNIPFMRSVENSKNNSERIYDGGISKSLIRLFAPREQRYVIPNNSSHFSTLLDWAALDKFLLKHLQQNNENKMDYNPWFAMTPRKTGVLSSFETSQWYQKLASHCVDWEPDSYSWNGFLCSGVTDFGINLFIEVIAFKDLVLCALIGYTTGDSLFCLTLYQCYMKIDID